MLRLVADGLTYREIGRILRISHRTVEEHVAAARRVLETRGVGDTVTKAIALGLIATRIAPPDAK